MKRIRVNYRWFYLQYLFLALMCVIILLGSIFLLNPSDDFIFDILWYCLLGVFTLLSVFFFFLDYQIAELTKKGITIKTLYGIIKSIEWKDIYDIRIESMISGTAGVKLFEKDWIIIQTGPNQFDPYLKPNRRKRKGPWYIAATKVNIKIVNEYLIKYLPNVSPIEI